MKQKYVQFWSNFLCENKMSSLLSIQINIPLSLIFNIFTLSIQTALKQPIAD